MSPLLSVPAVISVRISSGWASAPTTALGGAPWKPTFTGIGSRQTNRAPSHWLSFNASSAWGSLSWWSGLSRAVARYAG